MKEESVAINSHLLVKTCLNRTIPRSRYDLMETRHFAALKMFKLKCMTRLLFIPMMMKMRWTIFLKALAVELIGSSLAKQQTA